jgi:hypothetical protein
MKGVAFAGGMLLPVSAVMPALGRRSGLEKLGEVAAWKRALAMRAPDNVAAPWHCQTRRAR